MSAKKKHIRYDRIIFSALLIGGAIAILVSFINGIVNGAQPKDKNSSSDSSVSDSVNSTIGTTDGLSGSVYLSPSNQYENKYASGDTSEGEQMHIISGKVKSLLEQTGLKVYEPDTAYSLSDKVYQANELNVDIYVSIQSNSGGSQGTECFYNTKNENSKLLSECIYKYVSPFTPTTDRGVNGGNSSKLYEILFTDSPVCLVEVEFHDNPEQAEWIIQNTSGLAQSIADGIIEYFQKI